MIQCPECDGAGEYEIDVPRPHALGFNEGFIDSEWSTCAHCGGDGEVLNVCCGCGETMEDDTPGIVCIDCQEAD